MKGKWTRLLAAAALASVLTLSGCMSDGDDGAPGADGQDGADGMDGIAGPPGADGVDATIDPILQAKAESCNVCHRGVGDAHQAEYNKYQGARDDGSSTLTLAFDEATLAVLDNEDGTYDVTVDIAITENGAPLAAMSDLGLNSRFYVMRRGTDGYFYDSTRRTEITGADGAFEVFWDNLSFDPTTEAAFAAWIGDETVVIGDVNYDARMNLWQNVASDGFSTSETAYASPANVTGCEACHGKPYLKHGERPAVVDGLGEFVACRTCHYDDRVGGHGDWQLLVDDPYAYATGALTDEEIAAAYPYTANVMNDVHMSHAMEFPYPQSMANCATCHEGKLDLATANDKFTIETCKSCHPVTGTGADPDADPTYFEAGRAPALAYIWRDRGVEFHNAGLACQDCHNGGGGYTTFAEIHSGYDPRITDASDEVKWADKLTATIDSIDVTDNVVTVEFSVSDADMVPYIYLSFYGWDSKHMIQASHTRGVGPMCGTRACRYEAKPDDENALFAFTPNTLGATSYIAVMDLSVFEPALTNNIPTMIADDVIKTGIVTIAPRLYQADGTRLALDAVIMNFDATTGAEVPDYFTDGRATIDNAKCEACHDKLAVTFHAGSGRSTVEACRNCHVTTSAGSHLEMQSRSIDSYVHAIHSFQAFSPGEIDFDDPVEAMRYEHHIGHTFPNFTITNCEACHTAGVYNVPDQAKSLFGLSSGSDDVMYRDLTVPRYITGPASRACGGCHRADLINENEFGKLAAFNAHTEMGGTLVNADEDDGTILYGIIDKIMSMFQ